VRSRDKHLRLVIGIRNWSSVIGLNAYLWDLDVVFRIELEDTQLVSACRKGLIDWFLVAEKATLFFFFGGTEV
jgi:hypothetical protein